VYGEFDGVNGQGAIEVPFTPTRHELLMIVRHWADVSVRLYWSDLAVVEGQFSLELFAKRRLARARDLLGAEAVNHAIEEAEDEFRRSLSLTVHEWELMKQGAIAELHHRLDALEQKRTIRSYEHASSSTGSEVRRTKSK